MNGFIPTNAVVGTEVCRSFQSSSPKPMPDGMCLIQVQQRLSRLTDDENLLRYMKIDISQVVDAISQTGTPSMFRKFLSKR